MDAKTLRETVIKPKLVEVFGNALASALMTSGITASMKGSDDKERAKLMVTAICGNPKVVGMLGAAEARKQATSWVSMI